MRKMYRDISRSKSYFYYFGWTLLVFFGGFFLIFFFIFQNMFYVKRNQRIEIFIAAHGLKDDSIFKGLQKEFKSQGIIDVNVYSYLEDDINIFNYFSANGESADFIIFSETNIKDLEDYLIYNYYDVSTLSSAVPSLSSYDTPVSEYDNLPHVIKIFDGQDEYYNNVHHFNDYIEFEKAGKEKESYYLLIDKDSPFFKEKSNPSIGEDVLEYLLSSALD